MNKIETIGLTLLVGAFPFLKKERAGLGIYPEPSRRAAIFPSAKLRKGRIFVAIPNAALNNNREILGFYTEPVDYVGKPPYTLRQALGDNAHRLFNISFNSH